MIIPLAAFLVAVGGFGGWLLLRTDAPAAAASTTATVTSQTVKDTVAASGTVAAARTAELSFDSSGTVTSVRVAPGDRVTKGQVLATIDDDLLVAQQEAAQSALAAARSTLSEDTSNGAGDAQIASDEAQVVSAESALEEANDALGGSVLRATFSGRVTAVGLEVGDRVGSQAASPASSTGSDTSDTSSGTVTVVSGNRWVVDATVSSADLGKVEKGLQVEVTISGVSETIYGTVSEVGLVAETSSSGAAVFPVTVQITDRRTDLFAGTSADASIVVSQRTGVLTVDARALRTDSETNATYVDKVTDSATGATERVDVEIGQSYGLATEITKGLAEGDVVQVPGFTGVPGGGNRQQGGGGGFSGPPDGLIGVPGGTDGGARIELRQ